MDINLDKLVEDADRRALYTNQVAHAKERYYALNVLAWEGHFFNLTTEFMCFVYLRFMAQQDTGEPVILLDRNDEPVLIEDLERFVDHMDEKHTEAINDYYDAYKRLAEARTNRELIEVA